MQTIKVYDCSGEKLLYTYDVLEGHESLDFPKTLRFDDDNITPEQAQKMNPEVIEQPKEKESLSFELYPGSRIGRLEELKPLAELKPSIFGLVVEFIRKTFSKADNRRIDTTVTINSKPYIWKDESICIVHTNVTDDEVEESIPPKRK